MFNFFRRQLLSPNIQQKHYLSNGWMDGGRHVSREYVIYKSMWLTSSHAQSQKKKKP